MSACYYFHGKGKVCPYCGQKNDEHIRKEKNK